MDDEIDIKLYADDLSVKKDIEHSINFFYNYTNIRVIVE